MFSSRSERVESIIKKCSSNLAYNFDHNLCSWKGTPISHMTDKEVEQVYYEVFPEEYHRMVNILRNQCKTQPRRYREEL